MRFVSTTAEDGELTKAGEYLFIAIAMLHLTDFLTSCRPSKDAENLK